MQEATIDHYAKFSPSGERYYTAVYLYSGNFFQHVQTIAACGTYTILHIKNYPIRLPFDKRFSPHNGYLVQSAAYRFQKICTKVSFSTRTSKD